ncbi:MAG: ABC transporter ATP-binding protein [Clostridia bacterium]|nr:ABC transporter ATP-binding protein [Clostridia bacterium]NCC76821.1 ABC transporter ATP-binding protein [Clostridia bacterium]
MIQLSDVSRIYPSGETEFYALNHVSLAVPDGELVVILGPSGSGKSTLLNMIGGIDQPDSGTVFVNGLDVARMNDRTLTRYRRRHLGFVFQFNNLIPDLTVRENIEVTAHLSQHPAKTLVLLDRVGLRDKADKFPHQLSGGEQQRVSIARAIVKRPALLLCDEPTGALDFKSSLSVLQLLEEINQQDKTTILVVTHNSAIAAMADRVIRMRSGDITEITQNTTKAKAEEVSW